MIERSNFGKLIGCLLVWLAFSPAAVARVVGVEDGSGSGFLFSHRGNCFLILPGHLHGVLQDGIRVGSAEGGGIGTARVVYRAPGEADLSLALVRGGITQDCGGDWSDLPRSLGDELEVGRTAMVERARQKSTEGRRVVIHTTNFSQVRLVPAEGEAPDLFGGTSGAVVRIGDTPVAMILEAESSDAAWATRMDEVVHLFARFMGEVPTRSQCAEGVLAEACAEPPPEGAPFEVTAWSVHPVEGAADPAGMAAGQGPYIAPLEPSAPVVIELQLEADRLSRVRLISEAGTEAAVPKDVEVVTDVSADASPRPNPMPRRDMSPDGIYDNHVGERFARTVRIRITSSWGGGSPIRIDRIVVE